MGAKSLRSLEPTRDFSSTTGADPHQSFQFPSLDHLVFLHRLNEVSNAASSEKSQAPNKLSDHHHSHKVAYRPYLWVNLADTMVSDSVTPIQAEFRLMWLFRCMTALSTTQLGCLIGAKYNTADLNDIRLTKYDPKNHELDPGTDYLCPTT